MLLHTINHILFFFKYGFHLLLDQLQNSWIVTLIYLNSDIIDIFAMCSLEN